MTAPVQPTPCSECPWTRGSLRGWLGPYTPAEWQALAHSDAMIACHTTITTADQWDPDTRQCAGAAQYRRNVAKQPRTLGAAVAATRDTTVVFGSPREFVDHHTMETPT